MSSVDRHLARVTVAMAILLSTQTQGISQTGADAPQASERPALVSHVMPVYPQIAHSVGVSGSVQIAVVIGIDGRVADVKVLRSIPLLDQAAIDAIRQWRFAPSSGSPSTVTVTVHFILNDPTRYPRPAAYAQSLPLSVPENFAFVYEYECRGAVVEIDSIDRVVKNTEGSSSTAQQLAFGFEGEEAADVFIALLTIGLFEASSEPRDTWLEVPPAEPGIQQHGDEIVVIVPAVMPVLDVQNAPRQIRRVSGDRAPRGFLHSLEVRRRNRWTRFYWSEPTSARSSEHEKSLATAGKRIRALVQKNVTDAGMKPMCL
jgi:TonB family protein